MGIFKALFCSENDDGSPEVGTQDDCSARVYVTKKQYEEIMDGDQTHLHSAQKVSFDKSWFNLLRRNSGE